MGEAEGEGPFIRSHLCDEPAIRRGRLRRRFGGNLGVVGHEEIFHAELLPVLVGAAEWLIEAPIVR